MKKYVIIFLLVISLFITGCGNSDDDTEVVENNFITVEAEDDYIIIETDDITSTATFVNYIIDDVTIQFIVVRGTDGVVRIAFNTCQACNPSPNAYFVQVGENLVCQNCGNKFHIDKIGEASGGCNPAPVSSYEQDDDKIIIDKDYVDSYKDNFEDWAGPVE